MKYGDRILHEALIKNNVLTDAEMQQLEAEVQSTDESLQDFLLKRNKVTEKQVLIALSQTLNIDPVDLRTISIDPDVISKIPVKFVWYYKIIPLSIEKNLLTIATSHPIDVKTQDEIRINSGFEVKLVLTKKSELLDAIKKYYGFASDTIDRILTKDPQKAIATNDSVSWVEDLERKSEDPTISNLVNQIILEAYNKRATDIHIEPYRDKVRFRYRIDGVLVDANLPPEVKHFIQPILSRIKILANLSITEKRVPQDGSAVVKTKDQALDLRISTIPTPSGESMVLRILPSKVMLMSLEKLGFDESTVSLFRNLIQKPHGIIFITGPTGSGKTTTLYACLNEINSAKRKIITIEDPVEYEMEGVTQVQVNPKVNFDFSNGLRSILRHDPDIIMVGEVRDLETTEISIRTALTGHLVFSTLHTNDAASGITRLIDMGVEPYLVASSVEAFVAQRLVRVICPQCKEQAQELPIAIRDEIQRSLNLGENDEIKTFYGKGCDHCNFTGYYGRVAIYEILLLDDVIRAAILEKPRSEYIKKIARRHGFVTIRQNGWKSVLNGITTPTEVINVTVKDEDEEILTASPTQEKSLEGVTAETSNNQIMKSRKTSGWNEQNDYDARVYPRTFEPVEFRYRLVKRDPKSPNQLISDGIEYPTTTEDISAGGLRFISKSLLPVGSILELKIQLGEGHKCIDCLGKVCRVEEDGLDSGYSIISYYLDISSADRVTINKFVDRKLKDAQPLQIQAKLV